MKISCEADPYDCLQNENENGFVFVFANFRSLWLTKTKTKTNSVLVLGPYNQNELRFGDFRRSYQNELRFGFGFGYHKERPECGRI